MSGCDALRFAPSEQQKQNAWLHTRTAELAAQGARGEGVSPQLQALAALSELQSRAYSAYCGLPRDFPAAETPGQILAPASTTLARAASGEAARRPDPWDAADAVLQLGMGLLALVGGAAGVRAVGTLRDLRDKAAALREVVAGNDRLKAAVPRVAQAFKAAQTGQSPRTRQVVARLRAARPASNGDSLTLH